MMMMMMMSSFSFLGVPNFTQLTCIEILIRLNLEIQLTIKMSEKTERRFGVILAPLSSRECNRKDNLYIK